MSEAKQAELLILKGLPGSMAMDFCHARGDAGKLQSALSMMSMMLCRSGNTIGTSLIKHALGFFNFVSGVLQCILHSFEKSFVLAYPMLLQGDFGDVELGASACQVCLQSVHYD